MSGLPRGGTLLLAMALLSTLRVAVPGADVASDATETRASAEQLLKEGRTRILGERAELARQLADAYQHLEDARTEAAASARARATAEDQLRRAGATAGQDEQALRGAVIQLYAAARLTPPLGVPDVAAMPRVLDAISVRAARIADGLGCRLGDEEILDRDGVPTHAQVLRLGNAAMIAYGATARARGLLASTTSGRGMVSGPELPSSALIDRARLASGAAGGSRGGLVGVPLDLDGSIARAHHGESLGFSEWFASGGFFMWPILATGLCGFAIMIERAWWYARTRSGDPAAAIAAARAKLDKGAPEDILAIPALPLERVLAAGVASSGDGREAREAALGRALLAEEPALDRGLSLLAALAACAPLLGLLGTVSGMIGMFATIAEHGSGNPRLLSGHISVALVTTQFGLMVAVPLLVGHAWCSRLRERRALALEEAAAAMVGRDRPAPIPGRYDTEIERIRP